MLENTLKDLDLNMNELFVKAYNDGVIVYEGTLDGFLAINEHDEWLVEQCKKLVTEYKVEFTEISGHWVIERIMLN